MEYVEIDNTNIKVSRIGFGTASLHHLYASKQRQSLIHCAIGNGITHFDTSPYYGYGLAELELGKVSRIMRDNITITTKVGLYPYGPISRNYASVLMRKGLGFMIPRISLPDVNWSLKKARKSLFNSLKRLDTDYIDFLLLHEPLMSDVEVNEIQYWLSEERQKGTIRAWGIAGAYESVYHWVESNHSIANVIQTRDSTHSNQADFVLKNGRKLQFTYGYISSIETKINSVESSDVLKKALERNRSGSIIISTRKESRIEKIPYIFI